MIEFLIGAVALAFMVWIGFMLLGLMLGSAGLVLSLIGAAVSNLFGSGDRR